MFKSITLTNSSNLPWEFYWIRNLKKKQVVESCFSKRGKKKELVLGAANHTWKRNRNFIIDEYKKQNKFIPIINNYYNKLIPFVTIMIIWNHV